MSGTSSLVTVHPCPTTVQHLETRNKSIIFFTVDLIISNVDNVDNVDLTISNVDNVDLIISNVDNADLTISNALPHHTQVKSGTGGAEAKREIFSNHCGFKVGGENLHYDEAAIN